MGFPTPLARLFSGPLQDYVSDILLSATSLNRGFFKNEVIKRLLVEHGQKKADHHRVLWQLLVLELWQQEFLDT